MNESVAKLLKEQVWHLGTFDREPNVVPVLFKNVEADGTLTVGDVFLDTTLKNIAANGKVAISACDTQTLEGYQIKGEAKYLTEGPVVEAYKQMVSNMFHGAMTAKGVLVIAPEKVIVTTPGPNNKKEL